MALDKEMKDFIVDSNLMIHKDVIDKINKGIIEPLQKNTINFSKRFDDIDKRLEAIEGRLNIMNKQTDIIPLSLKY